MEELSYWSMQADQLFGGLPLSANGLSRSDATEIRTRTGLDQIRSREQIALLGLFFKLFKSSIVLILFFSPLSSIFDPAIFVFPPEWLFLFLFTKSQP
jgi:hypothetical protein